MKSAALRIHVIGLGNPGQLDDGLGSAVADEIARMELPGVTAESTCTLTIEDAATLAGHDIVIFACAATTGMKPFAFTRLRANDQPARAARYDNRHLGPTDMLELSRLLFNRVPEAYLLTVRGYEFNAFGECLSEAARDNLDRAACFLESAIQLKLAMVDESPRLRLVPDSTLLQSPSRFTDGALHRPTTFPRPARPAAPRA